MACHCGRGTFLSTEVNEPGYRNSGAVRGYFSLTEHVRTRRLVNARAVNSEARRLMVHI